jgi:hypothetical protein
MRMTCWHLIILIAIACVIVPVSADAGNTTNTTTVPTTAETTLETTVTTQVTTEATTATAATTATTTVTATTTAVATTTAETTVPVTNVTIVVTTNPTAEVSAGDVSVASSPLGASILLDGVYYGTTPGNLTGISPGNHIMRLALSGYYDYEGTIYVVPGQVTHVFGTLPPLSGAVSQTLQPVTTAPATTVLPATTVQPTATQTSSAGALENPTVIAAIIGIITACIGAGATIFTHISKIKKE